METHRASKAASPHPRAVLPACSSSFLTCPEAEASNYFHLHQEKYFWSHKQSQHLEKKKTPGGFPVLDDPGGSTITVTWEISSDWGALQGLGSVSGARGEIQSARDRSPGRQQNAFKHPLVICSESRCRRQLCSHLPLAAQSCPLQPRPCPGSELLPGKASSRRSAGASGGHQGSGDIPTVQLGEPLWARPANAQYVPKASCKYFCPTSFRYSSIALVASVFSLKMRCSFSPQRSTSDIIRSVKKSWKAKPMVGHHALTVVLQSSSSSPESSHLPEAPEGLEVLQVILCECTASPPARISSQRRGEIKLWRASTLIPQQWLIPDPRLPLRWWHFLAALVSASHSVGETFPPIKHGCVQCPTALAANQGHALVS